MELITWFEKGLTTDQYITGMKVNQSGLKQISEQFSLNEDEKAKLADLKDENLKVIVLSEDWCGDALLNVPILLKIAEETGTEVRFLLRDSNLELMDQYLTNGTARSIPIFVFINQDGEEQAVWGPRAQKVQDLVDQERSKLPAQDDPDFKDKQMAMYKGFAGKYQEDETLWHAVAESIIDKLISE